VRIEKASDFDKRGYSVIIVCDFLIEFDVVILFDCKNKEWIISLSGSGWKP
jgi:hypothetical protein